MRKEMGKGEMSGGGGAKGGLIGVQKRRKNKVKSGLGRNPFWKLKSA